MCIAVYIGTIEGVHMTSCHGNTMEMAAILRELSYRYLPLQMAFIAMVKVNNALPL